MTAHFVSLAKWPPFTSRLRGLIAQQVPGLIFAVGCWQAAHRPPPCISVRGSTLLCSILISVLEVTGHRVTLAPHITSHHCVCVRGRRKWNVIGINLSLEAR